MDESPKGGAGKSPVAGYNMHDAKTQLSRIVERVLQGEEVVINRAGVPVARVVPIARPKRTGRGSLRGRIELPEDWDSPEVNARIAADFFGEDA